MRTKRGSYFNMHFAVRISGLKYSNFNIMSERSRKLNHFLNLTIDLETDR